MYESTATVVRYKDEVSYSPPPCTDHRLSREPRTEIRKFDFNLSPLVRGGTPRVNIITSIVRWMSSCERGLVSIV